MKAKYTHIVDKTEEGLTINQILRSSYSFSARFKTKMKFQSLVDLNGEPAPGYIKPRAGDIIGIRLPEESSDYPLEDIPIYPLYEDDDLLIINKQPGYIVHPTKGHPTGTIANGLMKYMADTSQTFKIRFANRIDMDTSGIVIVAKNANAQNELSSQMRRQDVVKKYFAVVHGCIDEDNFTIDLPIGRPSEEDVRRAVMPVGGKDAVTEVDVLRRFKDYSFLKVTLHTGRTHQIRVHLSHIGHPIVGDFLYGGEEKSLIDRQALHARYIKFKHPVSGETVEIEAPLSEDICECIRRIEATDIRTDARSEA